VGSTPDASRPQDFSSTTIPVKGDEGAIEIPKSMNRVIVMLIEQDYEAFTVNGISMLNSAAASQGYSMMKYAAASVAAFVRDLGYQAIPMGNDTAQSIPLAIAAGLGEHARHGLLISPKFGSRVRICKVATDMPLNIDTPISFGVKEFCEKCELCSTYCPSGCIPKGDSYSFDTFDINNQPGVEKWQVDQEKCYLYWTQAGVGCSNCQSACPFTKPEGWVHEATKILIGAKVGSLDSLLANLDELSGYGALVEEVNPVHADAFWNREGGYVQNTDLS
jgi:reductive dehalogenase